MERPDVTISIVNHANREEVLSCLANLHAKPGRCEIEIVVLDNDSRDGSVEAIRANFPTVRVIAQNYTAGFGQNHNTIIRASTGRYIFALNDDTRVETTAIDQLVTYLDDNPQVGALGPKIIHSDGEAHPSAWRFPTPAVCAMWALTLGLVGVVQSKSNSPKPVDWVSGSAMMLRRSALEEVGLFDERIYMYMEETDLCRRLWSAGFQVFYYPGVTIVHRGWGSTLKIPQRRTNELWRSRRYYWKKHHSRLGGILAGLFDGLRYSLGAALAAAALLIAERFRPARSSADDVRSYLLNARNAFFGRSGDGIWELAIERNVRHQDSGGELLAGPKDATAHRFRTRSAAVGLLKSAMVMGQAGTWTLRHPDRRLEPGLRILFYHRVSPESDELAVTPERFRRQVETIAQSGYRVVDLWSMRFGQTDPSSPTLAITFDDGYQDLLDHALPVLEEAGLPATVFIVPFAVDGRITLPWYGPGAQPPLIQWDEMREIERRGLIHFEPHSLTHPRLPSVSESYAWTEIAGSKRAMEEQLGREARLFSYPGGYLGRREVDLVREAGFAAAVTCEYGVNRGPVSPYMLRRTPVDRHDFAWLFRARLFGGTDRPPPGIAPRGFVLADAAS